MTVERFPTLHGESLSRRPFEIPAGLGGNRNLVFVAFLQHQQRDIDRWMAALGDAEHTYPGLCVYEVPLLRRFPHMYRRMIDGGMRAGIPDPKTRDRTITVYTDRGEFLRTVGLPDEGSIWVVLLDRAGTILWSHIGALTDDALPSLQDALGRAPGP
jgi:hypothetical protein